MYVEGLFFITFQKIICFLISDLFPGQSLADISELFYKHPCFMSFLRRQESIF